MVYIQRDLEPVLLPWLDAPEMLILRGPRQSGKTTLLQRLAEQLGAQGVEKEQIHYLALDDDLTRLKFEKNPLEFIRFYLTSSARHYFLLDEVQAIQDVGKKLKIIFDTIKNIKLVVTGSSSFDLTVLGSFVVGRALFFDLYPFSFAEFLRSKGKGYEELHKKIRFHWEEKNEQNETIPETAFLEDLNILLHEYLTYGSYPRIVMEPEQAKKKELLRNVFTTYIEKDIVSLYGIKQREKTIKLLRVIAATSGQVVNYATLAAHADLQYHEVRELLPLLQDSFVIFIVPPFHKNLLHELRKNPKLYFMDYGLRNCLLENFEPAFDMLYENFVHNELRRNRPVKYWRTTAKSEVDFILQQGEELIPIEVKTTVKVTRSFQSFLAQYRPARALLCTLQNKEEIKIGSCTVYVIPFVYL